MHGVDGNRLVALHVVGLLVDDLSGLAGDATEIEQQRSFELRNDPVLDPQRIDDHPFSGVELHEVETAERRRVLVLSTAGQANVDAFDLVGEARDLVFPQWQIQPFDEGLDHRYDQRR